MSGNAIREGDHNACACWLGWASNAAAPVRVGAAPIDATDKDLEACAEMLRRSE